MFRGFFFYLQQNHLVYECKVDSFTFNNKKILKWKSTGIFNYSDFYSMKSIENSKKEMPTLKNDEIMYIYLQGNHFQQNNILTSNNDHVVNKNIVLYLYCLQIRSISFNQSYYFYYTKCFISGYANY